MAIEIEIFQVFWLLLPAGLANMAPPLFRHVNFLNYQIDFGLKIRGRPILGSHKTFRGFFFGILAAIIGVYIQRLLYPYTINFSMIDYSSVNVILIGFLLGFGALFGDSVKSFFKRQLNVAPGKHLHIFDRVDWIIGALLFINIFIRTSLTADISALVVFGILHKLVDELAYKLNIKE